MESARRREPQYPHQRTSTYNARQIPSAHTVRRTERPIYVLTGSQKMSEEDEEAEEGIGRGCR